MRTRIFLNSTLALCVSLSAPRFAHASSDEALAIGRQALEHFVRQDFGAAFETFSAAERLAHSPVFGLYMARCQVNLGKLNAARRLYEEVVREALGAHAPGPWHTARRDARTELASLLARIPSVLIQGASEGLRVRIDGVELRAEDLRAEIELDPGRHVVEVASSRGWTTRTVVDLPEGLRASVIDVRPREALSPAKPTAGDTHPPRAMSRSNARTPAHGRSTSAGFVVPLAIGGALVGAGAILGVIAVSQLADVRSRCEGVHCLESDEQKAENARRWAALSTAAFGVGGASLALGTVLYWTRADDTPRSTEVGIRMRGTF